MSKVVLVVGNKVSDITLDTLQTAIEEFATNKAKELGFDEVDDDYDSTISDGVADIVSNLRDAATSNNSSRTFMQIISAGTADDKGQIKIDDPADNCDYEAVDSLLTRNNFHENFRLVITDKSGKFVKGYNVIRSSYGIIFVEEIKYAGVNKKMSPKYERIGEVEVLNVNDAPLESQTFINLISDYVYEKTSYGNYANQRDGNTFTFSSLPADYNIHINSKTAIGYND